MFKHGFPPEWSTLKKLIWIVGSGIVGAASGIWKTVTGTLIHITDALASPMRKCEVTLEPIQDLHGQDAPYPAGGGKQLFDIDNPLFTAAVVGYLTSYGSKVEDGKLYNGGQKGITSGSGITIPAEEGNYTLSFYINGESATFEVRAVTLNQDNSWATYTTIYSYMGVEVTGQQTITVAFPSGYTHLFLSVYSATQYGSWETNVMIEKGSTASPWQPFSNICPITGWTGCEVNVGEANLLTTTPIRRISKARVNSTTGEIVQNNYGDLVVYAIPKTTICLYKDNTSEYYHGLANNPNLTMGDFCDEPWSVRWSKENSKDNQYAYFYGYVGVDGLPNYSITTASVEEVLPLSQNGTTLSLTFPDTVYGGKYEFVSGEGGKIGVVDVLGTKTETAIESTYLSIPLDNIVAPTDLGTCVRITINFKSGVTNIKKLSNSWDITMCNILPHNFSYTSDTPHWYMNNRMYLFLPKSLVGTTHAGVVSFLEGLITAGTPLSVYIPFEEPVPFAETPQPVNTLVGENNIWSDAQSMTVTYKAQAS
jgi:hypothetical protein